MRDLSLSQASSLVVANSAWGLRVAQKLVEASPKELVIAVINADSENSQIIPYKATAGQVDYRRNKQTTSEVTGGPEYDQSNRPCRIL